MLLELRVRELGVIADLDVVLAPGMNALTGETGAGKTLVVEALSLLLGGRADPSAVRRGAGEAIVEGRFALEGAAASDLGSDEVVLTRIVPAEGRSRSLLDGMMVPATRLGDVGGALVDIYGQREHYSLVQPAAQRQALDRFAGVDLGEVQALARRAAELQRVVDELGGDERARLRELDLLRYELEEIERAGISSAVEDEELAAEEELLAGAAALRETAVAARQLLEAGASEGGELGALSLVGDALGLLERHRQLAGLSGRLRSVLAELGDLASELRRAAEGLEQDPERLGAVRARRQLLRGLARKHGGDLAAVLEFAASARRRVEELNAADETRERLEAELEAVRAELVLAERRVGDRRRRAAPRLARSVEARFSELALPGARLRVAVPPEGIGDAVEIQLAANRGEPYVPLARAASGGELARTMLALRLVLASGPPTLVFDEVDAAIGGQAALAVGRALAELARRRQVLVVTHLAQVAAHADRQIAVAKSEQGGRTLVHARAVEGEERLAELSRMLSGHPASAAARRHAAELLASARR